MQLLWPLRRPLEGETPQRQEINTPQKEIEGMSIVQWYVTKTLYARNLSPSSPSSTATGQWEMIQLKIETRNHVPFYFIEHQMLVEKD